MSFIFAGVGLGVGTAGTLIFDAATGRRITPEGVLIGAAGGALTGGAASALGDAAGVAADAAVDTTDAGVPATLAADTGPTQTVGDFTVGSEFDAAGNPTGAAQPMETNVAADAAKDAGVNEAKLAAGTAGKAIPQSSSLLSNPLVQQGLVQGGIQGLTQGAGAITNSIAANQANAQNQANYNAFMNNQGQLSQSGQALSAALTPTWSAPAPVNSKVTSGLAKGGEVHLKSGSFVIPADIVSALGNGDTAAGQRFLSEFFSEQ